MSDPRPDPGARVQYDDVDDVIGIAAEMKNAHADTLSVADLESVASELDIPPHFVAAAVSALAERRRVTAASRAARRRIVLLAAAGVVVFAAIFAVMATSGQGAARARYATIEQRRAQVRTVLDRQAHVEALFAHDAPGPDRDAELAGAQNRVSIERRRYDEAAAEYNAAQGGWLDGVWARMAGVPSRVPMSNEVSRW